MVHDEEQEHQSLRPNLIIESPLLARTYQIGRPSATAALPPAAEIGDRKSAFMKIASAMPLIPVVILERADRLVVTRRGHSRARFEHEATLGTIEYWQFAEF